MRIDAAMKKLVLCAEERAETLSESNETDSEAQDKEAKELKAAAKTLRTFLGLAGIKP